MEKLIYQDRLRRLHLEYEANKKALAKEYAFSNNTVKIGDVITDHIGSIKVESFTFGYGLAVMPYMIYFGTVLKKDGTPTKKAEGRSAFQMNLIK